jgi:hypothetical protein
MAVCQEWDKQDFNFQKHLFGKSPFTQWALKQLMFEEIRKIYGPYAYMGNREKWGKFTLNN